MKFLLKFRFGENVLHLRKDKCKFGVDELNFIGFKIDALDIRSISEKLALQYQKIKKSFKLS